MSTKEELLLEEIADQLAQPPKVDLSDLIAALRALPAPPRAEDIAAAIVSRITFPKPEDIRPALSEVAEALRQTQQKTAEVPKMAFGNGVTIKNDASKPVPVEVTGTISSDELLDIKRGVTDFETRLDYASRTDSQPVYLGRNLAGTSTAATNWVIEKVTYDNDDRPTRKQVLIGAWDNRGSL